MQVNTIAMTEVTGRALMRLKEEYAEAVVESMTHKQALSYLRQIIYNDVAVLGSTDVQRKVIKTFGQDKCDEMVEDAVAQTAQVTVPTTL